MKSMSINAMITFTFINNNTHNQSGLEKNMMVSEDIAQH